MKKYKKEYQIFLALLTITILAVGAIQFIYSGNNTVTTPQVSEDATNSEDGTNKAGELKEVADPTASWQTYRNEEFGFEVNYPNNWIVQTNEDGNSFSVLPSKDSESYLRIAPVSIGGITVLDGFVQDSLVFVGRESIEAVLLDEDGSSGSREIRIVDLEGIPWGESNAIHYVSKPYDEELKNKFEQILSTFKFIPSTTNWQTYRNEEFGFEFDYPQNEEIVQETEEDEKLGIEIGETSFAVHNIDTYRLSSPGGWLYYNQENNAWYFADTYDEVGQKYSEIYKNDSENGIIVYDLVWQYLGGENEIRFIVTDQHIFKFITGVTYDPGNETEQKIKEEELKKQAAIMDSIVSTFKFIE